MNPITILLAEDHAMVREGLRALLKPEADFKIVGEAENGRQALELASKLSPNVIVMDISMPLLNGLEATRQIRAASPDTKLLILSAHSEDIYIERALALGASGYVTKQSTAQVLPTAIRDVHQGRIYLCPILAELRDQWHRQMRVRGYLSANRNTKLTRRESEVLQLVAEGQSNKSMAYELHLSIKTIEKHRQSLMAKLNIHDTASLTRHAIATGMIEG